MQRWSRWVLGGVLGLGVLGVVYSGLNEGNKIDPIQGLAYSPDGKTLYLATDTGILHYSDETGWVKPEKQQRISGFTAAHDALYIGNDGLQKSTDGGKTFEKIGASGLKFDFLAASLHGNTIYAYSLKNGLTYTQDEGKTWTHVAAKGLEGDEILSLAANPEDDRWIGVGTKRGMAMSGDRGETFDVGYSENVMADNTPVTALLFDSHDPDLPVMGLSYKGTPQIAIGPFSPKLYISSIKGGPGFWNQPLKKLYALHPNDEATHILANPSSGTDYIITTNKGDVIRFSPLSSAYPKKLIDHGTLLQP
ncbi:hypothetical protein JJB07_03605 [Tumebacillus sp. ITR2]|uniref:Sortilin N-terminal domain-containing protein n=1 Tax=Tumebacillus amylolyticus TaxID=2801339 RepID=A0ABS1J614_9BACL|nr:hypothetical protein [Tumebacillus amylolyticus]MBL0385728.1 hypothetical protein [Tumebacillus amylolyticus]